MAKALKTKPKSVYACCGCGDITTGAVSESTQKEYDCCRICCDRVDDLLRDDPSIDTEDTDRGPYRERNPEAFPKCPKCGETAEPTVDASMECNECFHEWTPKGIYAPRKKGK